KKSAAHKKLRKTLCSNRVTELLKNLRILESTSPKNALKMSRQELCKRLDRVLTIVPSTDKSLHQLRIAMKKLRYACECFEPLFPSLNALIEKAKQAQDILGDHQDAVMGLEFLEHFQKQLSSAEFARLKKGFALKKRKKRQLFFNMWVSYDQS